MLENQHHAHAARKQAAPQEPSPSRAGNSGSPIWRSMAFSVDRKIQKTHRQKPTNASVNCPRPIQMRPAMMVPQPGVAA